MGEVFGPSGKGVTMRTIAEMARLAGMSYGEFYSWVWTGKVDRPTHKVPMKKKPRYTELEATEILRKVRQYQDAMAE
jgi:hypothetical protein